MFLNHASNIIFFYTTKHENHHESKSKENKNNQPRCKKFDKSSSFRNNYGSCRGGRGRIGMAYKV